MWVLGIRQTRLQSGLLSKSRTWGLASLRCTGLLREQRTKEKVYHIESVPNLEPANVIRGKIFTYIWLGVKGPERTAFWDSRVLKRGGGTDGKDPTQAKRHLAPWHCQTGGSHCLLGSKEKAKLCLCLDFRLLASGYDTLFQGWCECPDCEHLWPPPCKAKKHRSCNCFSCPCDLQNLTVTNTDYKHSYGIW